MLNILINAYACSPNWGSEQGMAWNWIKNLSLHCNLYVITEGEYKDLIENAVSELPQKENLHFYYNPVSDKIRNMCWNQGDWRFYYYYRKWQYSTYLLALDIVKKNHIDVIHHLNMIGFREPGYLWKIKNIPYVWGPIGGMETVPTGYLEGAPLKQKIIIHLKNSINNYQAKHSIRVRKAIFRADILVAAVKGVKEKIENYYGKEMILINETGCYFNDTASTNSQNKDSFDILWVGKFDFRKQLGLALKSIAKIKDLKDIHFHIIGSGSKKEILYYHSMAEKLGIKNICKWYGLIPNEKVQNLMKESDLLLFTSIMEGTPHVVLEAIGNNLPVLCLDTCGQSASVNENVGIKIPVSNFSQSVLDLAKEIQNLYERRDILQEMSQACIQRQKELSWENKAQLVVELYQQIVNQILK